MIPLPPPAPTELSTVRRGRPACAWLCPMCSVGCAIATDADCDAKHRRATFAATLGDELTEAQAMELAKLDDAVKLARRLLDSARYEALKAGSEAARTAKADEPAPSRGRRLIYAKAKPVMQVAAALRHADRDRVPRPFSRRLPPRKDLDVNIGLHAR